MTAGYSQETLARAKSLRHALTDQEKKLWGALRDRRLGGFKFRKQQPIGPFIADFVCQDQRLIVEIDGSQHAESQTDTARDAFLNDKGYRVLRVWNNEVTGNLSGVLTAILAALSDPHPPIASQWAPPSP
ncbi:MULTISPECIES: endonuclease domain-containing protein [unclassified Sphingopyxis]|jgi:very-short-patch-repair endonuclease|uniref:endonuclease domain-containing protein n=1 Tax=unclassified Sphingopyxis TaxID=2614943 RepID=UPI0007308EC5|nr:MULTISPECIES: endonuclease domain-containing protein [unclassified Sphingopyxis]KTE25358.1 DNA methyltransferase [Sphingopyxis sp. H057]KTE53379.1 DNA methyltransferase [Sphingopyxis sp. H073]KTE55972.1 DNA methyltransferase [Sphingopyxis sp. H071]KTE60944.1 DNA methyltransferase [Sphingopyxis sp. H100]KTE62917.1 DNA methyltransferase [Sphingopyxis sp. H107]